MVWFGNGRNYILRYIKIENNYFYILIYLQYYWFLYIINQINANAEIPKLLNGSVFEEILNHIFHKITYFVTLSLT